MNVKLKWSSKPEALGELISSQLDDLSLCDVVFLCEDGLTGFSRWLLTPFSLLAELLPPPGQSCCEKLLRAADAKVFLSLPGVQLRDLQLVLSIILGSNPKMSPASVEVASMLGIPIRRLGVAGDMEDLVQDLLEEAVEKTLEEEEEEEEAMEDNSSLDDLEEELEFSFTGSDGLVDEITSDSSFAEVETDFNGSPMDLEAQSVDLVGGGPVVLGTQETEENMETLPSTSEAREEAPGCEIRSDGGEALADVAELEAAVSAQIQPSPGIEEDPKPATPVKVNKAFLIKTERCLSTVDTCTCVQYFRMKKCISQNKRIRFMLILRSHFNEPF